MKGSVVDGGAVAHAEGAEATTVVATVAQATAADSTAAEMTAAGRQRRRRRRRKRWRRRHNGREGSDGDGGRGEGGRGEGGGNDGGGEGGGLLRVAGLAAAAILVATLEAVNEAEATVAAVQGRRGEGADGVKVATAVEGDMGGEDGERSTARPEQGTGQRNQEERLAGVSWKSSPAYGPAAFRQYHP